MATAFFAFIAVLYLAAIPGVLIGIALGVLVKSMPVGLLCAVGASAIAG